MQMSEMLSAGSIVLPLKSTTKKEVIRELLRAVPYDRKAVDEETVYKAILDREAVTSTGVGEGVAIPHAKCDIREDLVMSFGISAVPVEFDSSDKKPVRLFFLLLSRKDVSGLHIRMLAKIAKFIRHEKFKNDLLACTSAAAAIELFRREESLNFA
ncbi:MAG: PTS sugar transporter subunit IIA [Fibrobacterota bacterium]